MNTFVVPFGHSTFFGMTLAVMLAASNANADPADRVTRSPYTLEQQLPIRINTLGPQPVVAMRRDGTFVAAFVDEGMVLARRFKADGSVYGPRLTVSGAVDAGFFVQSPTVAVAEDYSFIVVWRRSATNGSDSVLDARIFDSGIDGGPRTSVLNVSSTDISLSPSVATDSAGSRFAIGWISRRPATLRAAPYVRVFDGAGTPLAPALALASEMDDDVISTPLEFALNAQGIVAAWLQRSPSQSAELYAQALTRESVPIGDRLTLAPRTAATVLRGDLDVEMGADGNAMVAYRRTLAEFAARGGVYAREFNAFTRDVGDEVLIASGTTLPPLDFDITTRGHFAAAWMGSQYASGGPYLHVKLFHSDGTAASSNERYGFPGYAELPSLLTAGFTSNGNFVTVLTALTRDPDGRSHLEMLAQPFAGVDDDRASCRRYIATRVGTSQGETIHGTSQDDVIHAFGGNDVVNGWGGDDVICGGNGADQLFGGSGADVLSGGGGDDVLDGGIGWDQCNGDGATNADTALQCEGIAGVP